ncbi:MAG: FAA hydrolase family protein [Burkholderiaceae bacterium]|nr:MAG: FAA hydrolase family protein [Burkholderiaceae bacterium]
MKIGRCVWEGRVLLGVVDEAQERVSFVQDSFSHSANPLMDWIISGGPGAVSTAGSAKLENVQFLSPFSALRRNVFAVGKNYRAHASEFDKSGFNATAGTSSIPDYPQIFTKATTALSGPYDAISFDPGLTQSVDYEGEIAVVIGKVCRRVSPAAAMDSVFGYVLLNDVTARDLQKRHSQWFLGKSLDSFCPLGPWIATCDEVQADNCMLSTWVNGEQRQHACLKDLIFDIPTLVSTLSQAFTLQPGDLIATGTPVGVGIGFTPPRFLQSGDDVRISATGLGEMRNRVVTVGVSE